MIPGDKPFSAAIIRALSNVFNMACSTEPDNTRETKSDKEGSECCKAGTLFVAQISKHSGTGYILSIAEARVHTRVSPCRICGGQSGTVIGFSPSTSVLPCQ